MGMSRSKRTRMKAERAGKLNPEAVRGGWQRKPQSQVQPNQKAEQRRSLCRRQGADDGAVYFTSA